MESKILSKTLVPVIIILSFAIQIALMLEQHGTTHERFFRYNAAFDSSRFIGEARIIKEEGLYASGHLRSLPPVYPLLVAILGEEGYGIPMFQALLNSGSLALVYFLALTYFGRAPAVIALVLSVLYGPFYFYGAVYLRACLVTFESLAVVALLTAWKNHLMPAAGAGAMTALLNLTRPYPISVIAGAGWLFYNFYKSRARRDGLKLAFFCLAFILLIVAFPQSSKQGANGETGVLDHFLSGNVLDSNYGYSWRTSPEKERILKESGGSTLRGVAFIFREIAHHPVAYFRFYTKKLKMFLGSYEVPSNYNFHLFQNELSFFLKIPFIRFGWVVPFALLGIWETRKKWRENLLLVLWFAFLCLGIFIFLIQARYRLPVVPFFMIFGGVGVYAFISFLKNREWLKTGIAVCFLLTAGYFCRFDHTPLKYPVTGEDYYNLALAQKQAGNMEKARFYLLKSNRFK